MSTMDALPTLVGPIPSDETSYQFNTMRRSTVPIEPADHGYVEEEYFVEGTAAVYADDLTVSAEVPYVNRLIVRRPDPNRQRSGVVFLEILNASNGYDAEGLWRRAWDHWLAEGHTYVGISAKPITIDALKIFDPSRYGSLTWELDPRHPHEPARPIAGEPWNALGMIVDGAEEGLVWDIVTQAVRLLRSEAGLRIVGGQAPDVLVLAGQSQSGIVLNTWIRHFHDRARADDGRPLADAYLVSVASVIERPLRQEPSPDGLFATVSGGQGAPVDIPLLSVTCEGDVALFAGHRQFDVATPGVGDGPWRRSYCVPAAPHTELTTPVMPQSAEVVKAGRTARSMTAEQLDQGNPFPLEVAVTAAMDAVVAWARDGQDPPPSAFFETDEAGQLVRDGHGNVAGGVRYGVVEVPIATFVGSASGGTLGSLVLDPAGEVRRRFPTVDSYQQAVADVDDRLLEAGYLNARGRAKLQTLAADLWLRATKD